MNYLPELIRGLCILAYMLVIVYGASRFGQRMHVREAVALAIKAYNSDGRANRDEDVFPVELFQQALERGTGEKLSLPDAQALLSRYRGLIVCCGVGRYRVVGNWRHLGKS